MELVFLFRHRSFERHEPCVLKRHFNFKTGYKIKPRDARVTACPKGRLRDGHSHGTKTLTPCKFALEGIRTIINCVSIWDHSSYF